MECIFRFCFVSTYRLPPLCYTVSKYITSSLCLTMYIIPYISPVLVCSTLSKQFSIRFYKLGVSGTHFGKLLIQYNEGLKKCRVFKKNQVQGPPWKSRQLVHFSYFWKLYQCFREIIIDSIAISSNKSHNHDTYRTCVSRKSRWIFRNVGFFVSK